MTGNPPPGMARERPHDLPTEQAIRALTSAFAQHQLPQLLAILAQVRGAGALTGDDETFLTETLATLADASAALGQHRDTEAIRRGALTLYDDIMTAACALAH